jgi:hypothetical protein
MVADLHFERIPINRTNGRVIVWVIGLSEPGGFARRGAQLVFRANPESIICPALNELLLSWVSLGIIRTAVEMRNSGLLNFEEPHRINITEN